MLGLHPRPTLRARPSLVDLIRRGNHGESQSRPSTPASPAGSASPGSFGSFGGSLGSPVSGTKPAKATALQTLIAEASNQPLPPSPLLSPASATTAPTTSTSIINNITIPTTTTSATTSPGSSPLASPLPVPAISISSDPPAAEQRTTPKQTSKMAPVSCIQPPASYLR